MVEYGLRSDLLAWAAFFHFVIVFAPALIAWFWADRQRYPVISAPRLREVPEPGIPIRKRAA